MHIRYRWSQPSRRSPSRSRRHSRTATIVGVGREPTRNALKQYGYKSHPRIAKAGDTRSQFLYQLIIRFRVLEWMMMTMDFISCPKAYIHLGRTMSHNIGTFIFSYCELYCRLDLHPLSLCESMWLLLRRSLTILQVQETYSSKLKSTP